MSDKFKSTLNQVTSVVDLVQSSDLVVVGSGFYGATVAEVAARVYGKRVLVVEKRNHIGGNAYSYLDSITGIEVHKYGSHLFHTSNPKVYEYISKFTELNHYLHRVKAKSKDNYFDMPINLSTISAIFGKAFSPSEAKKIVSRLVFSTGDKEFNSLEDKAISLVGRDLYERLIRGYTMKQWQTDPRELPEDIIKRLPVRFDFNDHYFGDKWQGLPINGYEAWFKSMFSSAKIKLLLNTDYFDIKKILDGRKTIFTGPIDRYYDFKFGQLNWRTLDFEIEVVGEPDYQGIAVVNYVDLEVPWTRIHEFRHLHPERNYSRKSTIIMREFSRWANLNDEPYYPVNKSSDREKLIKYRELASTEKFVHFGGRLGTYQYLDMHMAIASALSFMDGPFEFWYENS
jgi:UDP-galactopyranose mutase